MIIENEDIICISSIDWDFIWQGHQEIMLTLAKNGNRVLFIENTGVRTPNLSDVSRIKKRILNWWKSYKGFRKELDNLYIYSPLVLPFPYSRIARFINKSILLRSIKKWMRSVNFTTPIIWTFLPTGTALDLINKLDKQLLIYYCIDSFIDSSASAKKIARTEKKLIQQSDEVFVTSQKLYSYCKNYNNNVHIFPFGVNIERFESVRKVSDVLMPEDLKMINKPIIGYIGGIHKWVDQDLIKEMALARTDFSFVMVGPIQTDISRLKNISNIHFLDSKDHIELPYYVYFFDICLIPYLITDYTSNVYPTKLNEYLAMGKPVVSTRLPEIEKLSVNHNGIIKIGSTAKETLEIVDKEILTQDGNIVERRIRFAAENTWDKRIEKMSQLISDAVERKKRVQENVWQNVMKHLIANSRKKMAGIAFVLMFSYLMTFYSPLIWMIAAPLKIADNPVNVDTVVIFGGGVGETGLPGTGTWERVEKGVELFKQGFGNNVIMATGYPYIFKEGKVVQLGEAGVMKNLAISLGVSQENIILETSVSNTYEYVKAVKSILENKNWDSVLIVSSPYHMWRTSLVVNKILDQTRVFYVPVLPSDFFGNEKRVQFKHIRAIWHEYIGIVYYWYKGYI